MSNPQHEKLAAFMCNCIIRAMIHGLDFNEGRAVFKCAAELMEQVGKTPNASEDALELMAIALIEKELAA